MSVSLYIGKKNVNLNLEFIQDVDAFCMGLRLKNTEFVRMVLQEVEQAEYLAEDVFKDRFGRGLYVTCLSTSSKALIALYQNPDTIINCTEIGRNALDYILSCRQCHAYFERNDFEFQRELEEPIFINGVKCYDLDDVDCEIRKSGV